MSQATARPLTSFSNSSLRVVLFGMPDAGKSSLLGALAQAAQSQEHALNAHLVDQSQGGLSELQRRLYEQGPRTTPEQVVPYPVTLEPFAADGHAATSAPLDAVLVDCDGRVANEILTRQRTLDSKPDEGPLGYAVLSADTLILVVDASASPDVLKRDFGQFAKFLGLLEQSRSQRADVAGMPVYLVLTKCDLLARKDDTISSWIERIEEKKRAVDRAFQEYLARHAASQTQPFGKVDLHLWATAVKRPALGETPARPREPYGVAELFRQCLDSARGYRGRRAQASRRLTWTVAGLSGVVAVMLLLGLFFWASQPNREVSALETSIRNFQAVHSEKPAARLDDPAEKIKQLQQFRSAADFSQASPELRTYVDNYLKELQAYQAYDKRLREEVQDLEPKRVTKEADLAQLLKTMERLRPPVEYAKEWKQTKAVRRYEELRRDVQVLSSETAKAKAEFQKLLQDYRDLESVKAKELKSKAAAVLREAERLPYREGNDRLLPDSQTLTYENVLMIDRVRSLYEQWQDARPEVKRWAGE